MTAAQMTASASRRAHTRSCSSPSRWRPTAPQAKRPTSSTGPSPGSTHPRHWSLSRGGAPTSADVGAPPVLPPGAQAAVETPVTARTPAVGRQVAHSPAASRPIKQLRACKGRAPTHLGRPAGANDGPIRGQVRALGQPDLEHPVGSPEAVLPAAGTRFGPISIAGAGVSPSPYDANATALSVQRRQGRGRTYRARIQCSGS